MSSFISEFSKANICLDIEAVFSKIISIKNTDDAKRQGGHK